MLRETTSRGRCELVCPSRTNERGGEGYCVKEGCRSACVCLLLQYSVCVFITAVPITKLFAGGGGGGEGRTCAKRDYEPRPV